MASIELNDAINKTRDVELFYPKVFFLTDMKMNGIRYRYSDQYYGIRLTDGNKNQYYYFFDENLVYDKESIDYIMNFFKEANPDIEIWAVEPQNAAILAGGTIGTHLQMGIGDGIIPENLNQNIYSEVYIVTDEEAIETAKDLARLEGIMCGISAGTNVAAAKKLAKKLGKGKTVVTVLPDTAERYFSTPLFEGE